MSLVLPYLPAFTSLIVTLVLALFRLETILPEGEKKNGSKIRFEIEAFAILQHHVFASTTEVSWENNYSKEFFYYWLMKLEITLWDDRENLFGVHILVFHCY